MTVADRQDDWRSSARCRGDSDANRWVDLPPLRALGGRYNPAHHEQVQALKAYCAGCPVMAQCRWFAVNADVEGVWGGLDEFEIHDLRDLFGLIPSLEDPDLDDEQRKDARRLAARRLANSDLSNAAIGRAIGVSATHVYRMLSDPQPQSQPEAVGPAAQAAGVDVAA